jgi:hypothetical protein
MTAEKMPATAHFMVALEWMKPVVDGQFDAYRELLGFSAGRLRAQAEFVQSLAECRSLPEVTQQQSQFVQKAWDSYAGEFPKVFARTGEMLVSKSK